MPAFAGLKEEANPHVARWLQWFLFSLAVLACVTACTHKADGRETVTFWAMGYEAEVVAQLIPEFERRNPGIRVDLQQLPWLSAHEKLLTAFAGESLPDVSPIGNTWIPEFVALGALDPLDEEIAATAGFDVPDYFPGVWDSGVVDGKVYAVPWYVETRLPFYRTDLLAKAGVTRQPRSWDEWLLAMTAREAGGGRRALRDPVAVKRVRAVAEPRDPATGAVAARWRTLRQFSQRGLQARAGLLQGNVRPQAGAGGHQQPDLQRLGRIRQGLLFLLHLRPLEHRQVQGTLAARTAGRLDDHAAARPGRAGRFAGQRHQFRRVRPVAAQGGGVEVDRVPVHATDPGAFPCADRRPAAAAFALAHIRRWPTIPMPRRSASSSNARCPRRRCPNGNASPRRCG